MSKTNLGSAYNGTLTIIFGLIRPAPVRELLVTKLPPKQFSHGLFDFAEIRYVHVLLIRGGCGIVEFTAGALWAS